MVSIRCCHVARCQIRVLKRHGHPTLCLFACPTLSSHALLRLSIMLSREEEDLAAVYSLEEDTRLVPGDQPLSHFPSIDSPIPSTLFSLANGQALSTPKRKAPTEVRRSRPTSAKPTINKWKSFVLPKSERDRCRLLPFVAAPSPYVYPSPKPSNDRGAPPILLYFQQNQVLHYKR